MEGNIEIHVPHVHVYSVNVRTLLTRSNRVISSQVRPKCMWFYSKTLKMKTFIFRLMTTVEIKVLKAGL